jgi:hypothetical protein
MRIYLSFRHENEDQSDGAPRTEAAPADVAPDGPEPADTTAAAG